MAKREARHSQRDGERELQGPISFSLARALSPRPQKTQLPRGRIAQNYKLSDEGQAGEREPAEGIREARLHGCWLPLSQPKGKKEEGKWSERGV